MKFDHQEIILLFISVAAGYLARYIYNVFPYSLIISVVTIIIVYYLADFILKKVTAGKIV
ncbi:MAG: hypothetical protein PHV39_02920 [Methanomicrobium sp.]|nr:hypothetical protein [Methanomicrobium sp.]